MRSGNEIREIGASADVEYCSPLSVEAEQIGGKRNNLMLAERRENEEWIGRYRRGLSDWRETEFDRTAVSLWSLDDFWRCIEHEGHRIRDRARRFVHRWCELANEHGGEIADHPAARTLVKERERALKASQSRFVNRTVLDKWGGRSGADRLGFRWREANSHIRDLTDAG